MDPADTIIKLFGGTGIVARITGVHRTRVSSWKRPKTARGSNGRIPQNHIGVLLAYAREHGIAVKAEDFLDMDRAKKTPIPQRVET